jgi:hypothetical protein
MDHHSITSATTVRKHEVSSMVTLAMLIALNLPQTGQVEIPRCTTEDIRTMVRLGVKDDNIYKVCYEEEE